jgi:hypothetical protein
MLFLVLQKEGRKGISGIQLRLTPYQIWTPNLLFLSLTIRLKRMRNKKLIVCSVPVVSLKTAMEKRGYDVRNILERRTQCVLVWRKVLFVSLLTDKHCVVLSLYPL